MDGIGNNLSSPNLSNQEIECQQSIDQILPEDVLKEIFSQNHFQTNARLSNVSKKFQKLTQDPILVKKKLYESEITITSEKWALIFGKEALKNENLQEEYASFPHKEIIDFIKKLKMGFKDLNPLQDLRIVRIPKSLGSELNLKNIGTLLKEKYPEYPSGFNEESYNLLNELGEPLLTQGIEKSYWLIGLKSAYPSSDEMTFVQQDQLLQELANNGLALELPTVNEAALILALGIDENKNTPFVGLSTRCKEKTANESFILAFASFGWDWGDDNSNKIIDQGITFATYTSDQTIKVSGVIPVKRF